MNSSRKRALPTVGTVLAVTFICASPVASAQEAENEAKLADPNNYDGAIAWLSDTQYYAEEYPEHFDAQTQWIADNADDRKIGYTAHTGDIVDDYRDSEQWKNASSSMGKLEQAGVPYGVLAGNHDVALAENGWKDSDYSTYQEHFGADRFADSPVYGESHENNRQHYDLVDIGGTEVLMLYLGWEMQEEDFAWAERVLAEHPNTPAMIGAHEYIDEQGEYSGQGEDIYDRLVQPHGNVAAVLSGHIHGAATNVKDVGDGRQVVEMLADYQSGPEGGAGFMRLLQFDIDQEKMNVDTYSPSRDKSNYFGEEDDFTVDLDLTPEN